MLSIRFVFVTSKSVIFKILVYKWHAINKQSACSLQTQNFQKLIFKCL